MALWQFCLVLAIGKAVDALWQAAVLSGAALTVDELRRSCVVLLFQSGALLILERL